MHNLTRESEKNVKKKIRERRNLRNRKRMTAYLEYPIKTVKSENLWSGGIKCLLIMQLLIKLSLHFL